MQAYRSTEFVLILLGWSLSNACFQKFMFICSPQSISSCVLFAFESVPHNFPVFLLYKLSMFVFFKCHVLVTTPWEIYAHSGDLGHFFGTITRVNSGWWPGALSDHRTRFGPNCYLYASRLSPVLQEKRIRKPFQPKPVCYDRSGWEEPYIYL